jgi:hypothetical protein
MNEAETRAGGVYILHEKPVICRPDTKTLCLRG